MPQRAPLPFHGFPPPSIGNYQFERGQRQSPCVPFSESSLVSFKGPEATCELATESRISAPQQGYAVSAHGPQEAEAGQSVEAHVEDDEESDTEGREACDDRAGLLRYLNACESSCVRITEATHVVNKWQVHGIVLPMKHHGVVFKTSSAEYLRAHLVRDGLAWKVYEVCPSLPSNTCYSKTYTVDSSMSSLRSYCQHAKPWSWPSNDCEKWACGALQAVGVKKSSQYRSLHMPHPHLLRPQMKDVRRMWKRTLHPSRTASVADAHKPPAASDADDEEEQVELNNGIGATLLSNLRSYSRVPAKTLFAKG